MRIVSGPVPVRVVNPPSDWPGWLSFIAAVLALVIAVAAIVITRRQAIAASRQVAIERRKVFELEVLRDLLSEDPIQIVASKSERGPGVALITALPPADLPLWRTLISSRTSSTDNPVSPHSAFRRQIMEILDSRGVPPEEDWSQRLWQALTADVRTSIAARVQDDQGGPRAGAGDVWHGLMGPGDPARG
jgi:hypothetical protein